MRIRVALILFLVATLPQLFPNRAALAADLPGEPGVSLKDYPLPFLPFWPGFYVGGHLGGAFGNTGLSDNFTYVGDPSFNGNIGGAGFIGGAQAGYNIQRGQFVFGFEGDLGYLGLSTNKLVSYQQDSCSRTYADGSTISYTGSSARMCDLVAKYSLSSNLYGDLTARLGYAIDRTLLYVKGGAAFLNADFGAEYSGQNCRTLGSCGSGGPSIFQFDHSSTLFGWTVGVGAEYALNLAWSLKAEYQHFDFGSLSYSYNGCVSLGGSCPGGHYTSILYGNTHVSVTADAVMIGLNYHIGGGVGLE